MKACLKLPFSQTPGFFPGVCLFFPRDGSLLFKVEIEQEDTSLTQHC